MTRFVQVMLGLVLCSAVAMAAEPAASKSEVAAPKPEPIVLSVDAARSRVEFKVVHTFHDVVGKTQKARGGVKLLPDGRIMVAVSAPIASFDSENSSRDVKMQEVLEATKYSDVVFAGTAPFTMPTKFPATLKLNVDGELTFHGRKKKETVPVEVTFASATEAHAVGKFTVSLEKYEVERPSLTFIKIHDACQIALDLLLKQ